MYVYNVNPKGRKFVYLQTKRIRNKVHAHTHCNQKDSGEP